MAEIEYEKIAEIVEQGHEKTVSYLKSNEYLDNVCESITGVSRDVHISDHKNIKMKSDFVNGIWRTVTYVIVATITSGLIGLIWIAISRK